jgi:hypothetical protein
MTRITVEIADNKAAFFQQFVELGGWGRAIGFPIAAIYFVILNSRIGGGQTIGKRILKSSGRRQHR